MNAAGIAHARRGSRRSGGSWVACCPAHEDRTPSLSLRDSPDGQVLVHCHAGCSQTAVIAALRGLGLWPEQDKRQERRHVVAEYNYTDESGSLLYQVLRTDPKGFLQRYPDGRGGWINRKHPKQVLYRLPAVAKASIVFVVEGEKDSDRLREYGFVATTNAGGAKAPWLCQYTESLRGRDVVLIPDNDPPGRHRVLKIARALLGNAARIIVIELSDGKDISEWFDRGHSELELLDLVERQEAHQQRRKSTRG
jgi:putative DNA primase/helicase